jgi:two-component system sensor histidine kinase/response regulator
MLARSHDMQQRSHAALVESQEQMSRARDMAEEAARTKSNFLANMSHEIRTPMNAIIGMSHLVMKTSLDSRQHDYIAKIQQAGHHLLGIINDILDFSKIEAGRLAIERVEFDLDSVLQNVVSLVGEKAEQKGLELIFDISPEVPEHLVGDPLRLGQVLINYVNNAVKFTDAGEVAITVRKLEESGQDLKLRFAVRDTGIGLSREQMDSLFQSFQQGDSSTTRRYGGTGLGLAISKNIAGLMGGEVGVESEPGKGATFWFTARLGVGTNEHPDFNASPQFRGRRVLVVDDNDHARIVIAEILSNMSFAVSMATSGEEAIQAIREAVMQQRPYEAVFIDWRMPRLDGIETARAIRQLPGTAGLHMVLVTAYAREESIKQAGAAGMHDVLIKPINASLLFNVVMRIFAVMPEQGACPARMADSRDAELDSLRGARILLVEDDKLNQLVGRELLRDAGFKVEVAEDGAMALKFVNEGAYDLVLMDMQMPVMDGIEATRQLRAQARFSDLPIVAMTANALASDKERCLAAGMNDHLVKPIDPVQLRAMLKRHLLTRGEGKTVSLERHPVPRALPDGLPGLDVRAGLDNVLGKHDLYAEVLDKFVATQKDAVRRLHEALAEGDGDGAGRIAHTLKGAAGTVGAAGVRQAALRLEEAICIAPDAEAVSARLVELGVQLDPLIAALIGWQESHSAMQGRLAGPPA